MCKFSKDRESKTSYFRNSEKTRVRIWPNNTQNKRKGSSTQCNSIVLQGVIGFDSLVAVEVSELSFSTVREIYTTSNIKFSFKTYELERIF